MNRNENGNGTHKSARVHEKRGHTELVGALHTGSL